MQTAAPFPLVPAYTRTTSSSVLDLTRQDHSPSQEEEASQEKKPLDPAQIADWFARKRANDAPGDKPWRAEDIETVLRTAVDRRGVTLDVAAQALRELVEGREKYGPTGSPWRLLADTDPGCWAAVRPKSAAARRQLAAEPRCPKPGHTRYPADRCTGCMSEKLVQDDGPEPVLDEVARAKAEATAQGFLRSVRQRRAARVQERPAGGGVAAAS